VRVKGWRWAVVTALVVVLASLPSLAGALLPKGDSDLTAEQLRELVRQSSRVVWEGLGESRSDLPLPDVEDLDDVPALLGGTTRTRTTWLSPDRWRIDRLDVASETDTIQDVDQTTTWDSADRTVDVVVGDLPVRLPRAGDLSAPVLGRRLAGTPGTVLSRLDERRVAGRTAAGFRLTPRDPARTTVSSIDIWADPDSGLALRVEVRSPGQRNPVLTSLLLDLDVGSADAGRIDFVPPEDADVASAVAPDIAAEIDRFAPFALPPALAGDGRSTIGGLSNGGVAVYGEGLEAYVVVPLEGRLARRFLRAADQEGLFPTPLVNALVGVDGQRVYLLVGTVPASRLQAGLTALREDRPERVR
jgi:hypothetical protein